MASPQLDRIAESSLLKLLMPVALGALGWFMQYQFQQLNDQIRSTSARMERVEGLLNDARAEARADKATTELRLTMLEKQATESAAAIGRLNDRVLSQESILQSVRRKP